MNTTSCFKSVHPWVQWEYEHKHNQTESEMVFVRHINRNIDAFATVALAKKGFFFFLLTLKALLVRLQMIHMQYSAFFL